ncbi:hypothetical protein [Actinomadura nitritigenes]|uniref:hypothetical protein n=1 Tax=Actinomadura nitritigenes TaxID=134602 RepID=UPI003D933D8F
MITLKDADSIPVSWRRRLEDLATRYPVGLKVRHEAGWTGVVTPDSLGNVHGLDLDQAHCLTGGRQPRDTAVCVHATVNGIPVTAWYRPEVLTLVGKGAPVPAPSRAEGAPRPPRSRTRRAA